MNNLAIRCRSNDEIIRCLKWIEENYPETRWNYSGRKPTQANTVTFQYAIFEIIKNRLSWFSNDWSFSEFHLLGMSNIIDFSQIENNYNIYPSVQNLNDFLNK